MSKNLVIAIGREFGSGGREIAEKVAEKLGIKMYDKELVSLVAKNSGMSEDVLHEVDETATNSFLYALSSGAFAGTSVLSSGVASLPITDKAFINASQIIKDIAEKEPCVIVGRCAESILAGRENMLTVFIHADIEKRIARIMETENKTRDEAIALIKKVDKKRAAYHNYYSDTRWGARNAYDLCLNSGLGINVLVDIIVAAAKDMEK
ncbi:MAG: cytidylate kinase-like family protein [Clostridia bacterium]|nr:cytidylate kinase-like family protein [Clostridia bacterium]